MAQVNQPPVVDDPALAAWLLELARAINEIDARLTALEEQLND